MGELVAISFFIGAFLMVFGIRYLANKEKMAMIERGIDPGTQKATPKPFLSLKFGLLLVGLGVGLLVAMFTVNAMFGQQDAFTNVHNSEEVAIYFGCLGIFGGLGLIISYFVEKKWLDAQP
ncbi:hypothetical protein D9M68_453840 [compost metagenome]